MLSGLYFSALNGTRLTHQISAQPPTWSLMETFTQVFRTCFLLLAYLFGLTSENTMAAQPSSPQIQCVLKAHKKYAQSSRFFQLLNPPFTMVKSGIEVTYLPEIHHSNGDDAELAAQEVVSFLVESGELILIENNGTIAGKNGADLIEALLPNLVEEGQRRVGLGIILNLIQSDINPGNLVGLEDYYSEEEKAFRTGRFSKAWRDLQDAYLKKRDEIQATVIEKTASALRSPNHIWAIGGADHAPGVRQLLKDKGWKLVADSSGIGPDQETKNQLNQVMK